MNWAGYPSGVHEERLFIPMNEENGLEIENNYENIGVYFIFKISGKIKVNFIFYTENAENDISSFHSNCAGRSCSITYDLLKADKVTVIVANKETGKVYLNKIYQTVSKPK